MRRRMRPLGLIPSPRDHRDYHISRITSVKQTFNDQFLLSNLPPTPYDQGDISACVAFCLKAIKESDEARTGGQPVRLSAAYIYGNRGPEDFKGEGMIPREALSMLLKSGVCREQLFPGIYPYQTCKQAITSGMNQDAANHQISAYAAVHTPDEIKTALTELGPVMISIEAYDSFFAGGNVPNPNKSKEKMNGYHALAIVGWTKDNRWVCLNSWGKDWGPLKGYCTIPFDYPISEMWTVTSQPTQDKQPEYRAYLSTSRQGWTVHFDWFKSETDLRKNLIDPLTRDLQQIGKELKITRIRK
ncbi:MAG: C1 family peptidase [Candidatus Saccharibacteria bacterium]